MVGEPDGQVVRRGVEDVDPEPAERRGRGVPQGRRPFGGGRASGTNDKAGSKLNLTRWVTARVIKETFAPPLDYTYPVMSGE